MKSFIPFSFLIAFSLSYFFSYSHGIHFENDDWNSVIQKARKEKKLIFVNCEFNRIKSSRKDKLVRLLHDRKTGKFYKKNFICYKVYLNEDEGKKIINSPDFWPKLSELGIPKEDSVEFSEFYPTKILPVFLFIDTNNVIVHRQMSVQVQPEFLINLGKDALNPEKRFIGLLNRYKSGDRVPEFLRTYIYSLMPALGIINHKPLYREYFSIVKGEQLITKENYYIIRYSNIEEEPFQYFLKNRDKFLQFDSKENIDTAIYSACYYFIRQNAGKRSLEDIEYKIKNTDVIMKDKLLLYAKVEYFYKCKMWKEFSENIIEYFDKYPCKDTGELSFYACGLERNTNDIAFLRKATQWMKRVMELKGASYYSSYAAFLLKTGDNLKEAEKYTKRSMRYMKKKGYPDPDRKLLKEIKEKRKTIKNN